MSADQPKTFMLVIHGARAEQQALRHLVGWVRDKGHTVLPRVTWEAGDALALAREGVSLSVDAVIAVGGDGTVNEVVNGLAGSNVPLGIIPLGTANDFARQTGIPEDLDHAMDIILHREPTRLDTASLGDRRFLNVSSGGIGAEATAETPLDAKEALGPLAYAWTGIRMLGSLHPFHARAEGPGVQLDTDCLLFAVGNTRATGGGVLITPRARIDDGLLDICLVESRPLRELAPLLMRLRRGEHLEDAGVHYAQSPHVTIDTDSPVHVNVDGEPLLVDHLEYRANPGELLVHIAHLPGDEAE